MPTHNGSDKKGKFWQWGQSGKKYYVSEFGEMGAKAKAEAQTQAIYASGYKENKNKRKKR